VQVPELIISVNYFLDSLKQVLLQGIAMKNAYRKSQQKVFEEQITIAALFF
jgi:hypothetical protein